MRPPEAQQLGKAIRQHWSIENQLHWVLDVTLRCRDGGSILPRFIYLDLRLNVIPPIPALSREPAEVSSARERSARGFLRPRTRTKRRRRCLSCS